ncbi:MAG: extracellular solute-binding protein [Eubacterium sp.]|nr:extracellular solute-binding protein [Eubacterium sp.]MCM1304448.1 extracellular solute-binding protein [Butyrivibrio sp.]MCM1343903.1 extracellular solute-binding protein [Muribaculaceae bacterium]MCM1408937.1 extracellular solute-binding protein [Lachnospiraceae bacterium]
MKPEKITVMVDGTFYTQPNGQAEWVARFKELTGIDLEIIQPDHSSYYDTVSQTIAAQELPDVIILGSSYYSSYASEGILWDMTDAWNNSEMKQTMSAADVAVEESMMLNGRLYGLARGRGNGAVTYIKKAWLDNVGLSMPTTYEEYLAVCDAFVKGDPDGNGVDGDTYAVSAAGLIGPEAPWVNYLPEFYQDAYPSFYIDDSGNWVDGFTEPAMRGALERLRDAYAAGYIDPETLTNDTKAVRNKFYENKTGIFTYWAGKWADNLRANLDANGVDSELVACPPIAEVGTYIDRSTGGYCITSACENPEGVFKWFFEPMFAGGDLQTLWLFGVEGVHWSQAAEEVNGVTYEEGQIHGLDSRENPGTSYAFDCLPLDVGVSDEYKATHNLASPEVANASQEMFNQNSRQEDRIVSTDEMSEYNGDLMSLKKSIIANVVTQGADIDAEFARFESEGGTEWSQAIVDSLNALK